jgi:hypothetical protein
VDRKNNFHYHEVFSGEDASSLTAINGDLIVWILDSAIEPRTFQIDFGEINPFQFLRRMTRRGTDYIGPEKVNFPDAYKGNKTLKYTVSLGNGWQDDPDVVPVPPDAGTILHGLILTPDGKISWTDNTYVAISLNPAEIVRSAGGGRATVIWQWDVGSTDPAPPFHLHFDDPVPSGCQRETDSTNAVITLTPAASPKTRFVISTTKGDGSQDPISKDGHLTIT